MDFNRRGAEAKQENKIYTMKKIVIAISILMMSISCGEIFAQKDGFSLHLSGVFPNGKFGELGGLLLDYGPVIDGGAASIGFGLGVKYQRSISLVKNLRAMFEADIMYNPLQEEIKDALDDLCFEWDGSISSSVSTSKYLNIPLMAGLNYSFDLAEKIKLYGELGVGLNVRLITKNSIEKECIYYYNGVEYSYTTKLGFEYNPAVSFACQVGVGVLLSEKLSVGLNYYNLGSAKVKGTYYEEDGVAAHGRYEESLNGYGSISPSMLTLKVGYHF